MKSKIFIPRNTLLPKEAGVAIGEELAAVISSFLENCAIVFGGPDQMPPWQEVCIVPYVRKKDNNGQPSEPPFYLLQGIYFASTVRRTDEEIQDDIMDLLRADSESSTVTLHAPGSKFDVKMSIETEKGGRIWIFFNHIDLSVEDEGEQKGLRSLGNYEAVEELMDTLVKTVAGITNAYGLG